MVHFQMGDVNDGLCRESYAAELPGTLGGLPEEALVDPITELGADSWAHVVARSGLGSGKLRSLQRVRHVPELSI